MKIFVKVKARAKCENVEKIDDQHFLVSTKEVPVKNKANQAIVKLLAKYFKTASLNIAIKSGERGKNKIIEILKNLKN